MVLSSIMAIILYNQKRMLLKEGSRPAPLAPPSLSTKGQRLFLNHYLNKIPLSETLGTNPDYIYPSLNRPLLLAVFAKKIAK
jgi:hypothetical protein